MADIIQLYQYTNQPIPADEMLRAIADENPKHAFVIVWPDGLEPSYHSNTSDMPVILMRLQQFIHKYYNGDFRLDPTE